MLDTGGLLGATGLPWVASPPTLRPEGGLPDSSPSRTDPAGGLGSHLWAGHLGKPLQVSAAPEAPCLSCWGWAAAGAILLACLCTPPPHPNVDWLGGGGLCPRSVPWFLAQTLTSGS